MTFLELHVFPFHPWKSVGSRIIHAPARVLTSSGWIDGVAACRREWKLIDRTRRLEPRPCADCTKMLAELIG